MPKLKPKSTERQSPPIDWLWAAVLERKQRFRYDLKQMAKIAGISYEMMRHYINQSPWDWSDDARERICKEFGIKPIRTVQFAPSSDMEVGQ